MGTDWADLESQTDELLVCFKRTAGDHELPLYVLFFSNVVVTIGIDEVLYPGPVDFFTGSGLRLSALDTCYARVDPDKEPDLPTYSVVLVTADGSMTTLVAKPERSYLRAVLFAQEMLRSIPPDAIEGALAILEVSTGKLETVPCRMERRSQANSAHVGDGHHEIGGVLQ